MERWSGKVAIVTGASAGIGAAIVIDLVKAGLRVIGLARRVERVEALKEQLPSSVKGELHAFKCDVTLENDIKAAFKWVETEFGGVDILVNNAGIIAKTLIIDSENTADMKGVVDTNIMGPALCTREAFQSMKKRNVDGHVVMINSVAGHIIRYLPFNTSYSMYHCTKFAITAMTEVLRQEFQLSETKIKITSVSPGAVETEIFGPEKLDILKKIDVNFLKSEDVSNAVMFALSTPPHVQIHEITIRPMGEKF